jgi:hypothetical protein
MEPILSAIVAALVTGATAAVKDVANASVKDAYAALKAFIVNRYKRKAVLDALEEDPNSSANQEALAEALSQGGATTDDELLVKAESLIGALKGLASKRTDLVGIDFNQLEAGSILIKNVRSTGVAVRAHHTTIHGGLHIEGVEAGISEVPREKKP